MNRRKWIVLCLAGCLLLALSACGNPGADAENSGGTEEPTQTEEPAQAEEPTQQETLVEYAVEGLGTFTLPEGFTQEAGEIAEPLPTTYATFEKDGYYIQANRFGTDAYEMAGVPLPTDLEDYSAASRTPYRRGRCSTMTTTAISPPSSSRRTVSCATMCCSRGRSPLAVSTSPPRRISLTRTRSPSG